MNHNITLHLSYKNSWDTLQTEGGWVETGKLDNSINAYFYNVCLFTKRKMKITYFLLWAGIFHTHNDDGITNRGTFWSKTKEKYFLYLILDEKKKKNSARFVLFTRIFYTFSTFGWWIKQNKTYSMGCTERKTFRQVPHWK